MGRKSNFLVLALLVPAIWFLGTSYEAATDESALAALDTGDTAWMVVASAFVLLMTPGLAFFYGGMVDKKHIISTMLQSFVALGVISVLWVLVGFSLCFGDSLGGIVGDPRTFLAFRGVGLSPNADFAGTIPFLLFALFQLKFAIITPALITGSMAGRVRFRAYILFMVLFALIVYPPLCHMTWHPDGLLRQWGVLDFAGGTVVHMSAGCAALAGALFLGRRMESKLTPANIPFVILGTGLLWFGWFGFNAGSAFSAGADAVLAFANTNLASATAMITWIFFDRYRDRKDVRRGRLHWGRGGLGGHHAGCWICEPRGQRLDWLCGLPHQQCGHRRLPQIRSCRRHTGCVCQPRGGGHGRHAAHRGVCRRSGTDVRGV